jgi:phosphopantetheinyl transferase (holo-ACP synthase)
MSDVTETDYTTNPPTITERDFTPEEIAQQNKDAADAAQAAADAAAKEAANAAATAAAIAHAKSLGFTDAMIAVMYPNLGGNNE